MKIGILDSGVGGLSILKKMIDRNYGVDYYYISDQKNVPYGEKTQSFMLERIELMTLELLEKEVSIIVIACNTLTVETIDQLRELFQGIQFIGIEPYINYVNKVELKEGDRFALILTQAACTSDRFQYLKTRYDPQGKIDIFPLNNLASMIESSVLSGEALLRKDFEKEISPLKNRRITHLILGCTHYQFASELLEKELCLETINPHSVIIDRVAQLMHLSLTEASHARGGFYRANLGEKWKAERMENLCLSIKLGSVS